MILVLAMAGALWGIGWSLGVPRGARFTMIALLMIAVIMLHIILYLFAVLGASPCQWPPGVFI